MTGISTWDAELRLAERAARAAGDALVAGFGNPQEGARHLGRDVKLDADRKAEAIIFDILSESPFPLLGEESGGVDPFSSNTPVWVVDPLDGTFNYFRGIDLCCVSIGLWGAKSGPVVGVVHSFVRDELFRGAVGQGAELNGSPIRVSTITHPAQAVVATGFTVRRDYGAEALQAFIRKAQRFRKVRMIGSAALALAMVACGRVDGYFEEGIMDWDVGAGLALVTAAGGFVQLGPDGSGERGSLNVTAMASPELLLD